MAKALLIPDVAADTPVGIFAARVIETRAGEVAELVSAVSRNGSISHVHDRRVAIRRLRTAIEVFDGVLPKRAKAVRRELKDVFSVLGPRRDADVAVDALRALEPELATADLPGWKGLVAAFEAQAAAADAGLDPATALQAATAASSLAEAASERDGAPADAALRRVARRRLAAVTKRLGALAEPSDAEALHGLRIAAKRLRYTLEAAGPAIGPAAADGAGVARDLQTVLGDIHDCDVMLPRIEEHRRALRAADVAAVGDGRRAVNAARYRGVQTVDTLFRARRVALCEQAAAAHARVTAGLERLAAALKATP